MNLKSILEPPADLPSRDSNWEVAGGLLIIIYLIVIHYFAYKWLEFIYCFWRATNP